MIVIEFIKFWVLVFTAVLVIPVEVVISVVAGAASGLLDYLDNDESYFGKIAKRIMKND